MSEARKSLQEEIAAFDWDAALQQYSSTDERDRKRCPYCLSSNIARKTPRFAHSKNQMKGEYRCEYVRCARHFDDPVTGYTDAEAGEQGDSKGAVAEELERDEQGRFLPRGESA